MTRLVSATRSPARRTAARPHARLLLALLFLSNALLSCRPPVTPTPTPTPPGGATGGGLTYARSGGAVAASLTGGTSSMSVILSPASPTPAAPEKVPAAVTQPLTAAQVQAVLDRLPELAEQPGQRQEFRLPPQTLPAPRPGQTIPQTFPPSQAVEPGPQPTPGPLQVLRYSPEGDVDIVPYLSVTFDQPMVPLATLTELAAKDVPVRLSPLPEGAWRWVGTKTLLFEPPARFPKATRYSVEIPAGSVSATGGKLAQGVTWSFTTPPPKIESSYPTDGPQVRNPLLFIGFDQRIDPAAVLKTIRMDAGGQAVLLRLATPEEVQANQAVAQMAKGAVEGRWLAFRPSELLPSNTGITVEVGPGTPSAEGPLTTTSVQSFHFSTYGPLRVLEAKCGWDSVCRPLMPWSVRFSNPLDEQAFDETQVQIRPELPDGKLSIYGDTLQIEGQSQGSTTYQVTLKASISDVFSQTLGQDQVLTFAVGSAEPVMYASNDTVVVLDPAAKPSYSVFTINYHTLRVKAYAVQPSDWPEYVHYLENTWRGATTEEPPGRKVLDKAVPVESKTDALVETAIDLTPLLSGGKGHVALVVTPEDAVATATPLTPRSEQQKPVIRVWVQATRIGLDAFVDGKTVTAWANALTDGASLSGVQFSLYPGDATATSDAHGLARLALPVSTNDEKGYLLARLGDDTAFLQQGLWWGGTWGYSEPGEEVRWYVVDDRQMYRPGETVHVKGWIRLVALNEGADVFRRPASGSTVEYQLQDSRGNVLLTGRPTVNALGGFYASFTLPDTMNLGPASLNLTLHSASGEGASFAHALQVQEFRRPEFEVAASVSAGPHFAGGSATATVEATYYAGGPLPNADVTWQVTSQPGEYRPPNWDDFTFGIWKPWWRMMEWGPYSTNAETRVETFTGRTDAAGAHSLRLDFRAGDPPQPTSVTAEATVMDVNRQAWSSSATLLVHPADLYVGLRTPRTFVEKGKPILVDAIVTDLDGKAVADRPIELRAVRLDWTYKKGEWKEEEQDAQDATLGSALKPTQATFQTPEGGTYRITATITDAQGRHNLTQITVWVSGGQQPSADHVQQEDATLVPDRKEYQPGDTAEILVQSPFAPAEGLLTLRRGGLVYSERFRMTGSSYTLKVPVLEAYIPSVGVQVDLVGAAPRRNSQGQVDASLPSRPAFASGSLELSVPPYARTLALEVTPDAKELEPGAETWVRVAVKDTAQRPVAGAEVAVIVVDEAVLALTGYQLADPLAVFYTRRDGGVSDYHLREQILLVDPAKLAQQQTSGQAMYAMAAPAPTMAPKADGRGGGAEEAAGQTGAAIRLRTNLDPLATFAPELPTDADGRAAVKVKLPDNLTRYRVMAVAVVGDRQFGKGESSITARLPLMVRPSPPRFLNFGDQFELPIVVQNQTDQPMDVDVAVRATNVRLTGGAGQRLTVPPRDRREVRFAVATESVGTASFQVGATSGSYADAAEFSLPVYTPATTEAFAVYGTIDQGAIAQPVLAPTGVYTQFGGLDISTSSTALQALSDAVLYLVSYPFECSEQLASRILAVAALRDVLSAFHAEGLPAPQELLSSVQRDIEKLQSLQTPDGGFGVWRSDAEAWPFHSIHAAHALARARQKGFTVPDAMWSSALEYLRNVEVKYPSWYGEDVRNTLTSYALYVRTLMGDADVARARRLIDDKHASGLQPEALGWLLYVLSGDAHSASQVAEIRLFLGNRVVETAGAANFTTSYREDDGYLLLASDRRADGVILEALIRDQPKSDLIPKLVAGLMAQRKQGRWDNTQECVFILLALDKYFQTYEAQTPEFVARVWLGDTYVAGLRFAGRSADYQTVRVPMDYLAAHPAQQNLILSKEGVGRLYYRLGLQYAPTDLKLEPLDAGFTVLRSYEGLDDPADVRRDADGVWHVRAGARVRVRLTLVAPSRRYHVALSDPLPAGFEPQNPALAVTGSIPQDPTDTSQGRYWWWNWTWYEHQNLRDQRAEAFASLLWEGVHTYTYVARATTPGQFVAPPPKAEEMYSPEVFGRGASERVVVE